jgi:glycosyltransferase involved in cell wall biosynthesis
LRFSLITEIIAPYRIPVFNELATQPGLDLNVIFLSETDKGLRQWEVHRNEIQFSHVVLRSWRGRFFGYNFLVNAGLSRALRSHAPDVVCCGGYNYIAAWQAAFWARRRAIPLLLWAESNARDRRHGYVPVEMAKRQFVRMCAAVIVAGTSSCNYMRTLGTRQGRIFTAPDAVDNDYFRCHAEQIRCHAKQVREELGLPHRFFLFAGRILAQKGIFDLLDAYARLKLETRMQVGLVFVGDGVDREKLMAQATTVTPGHICCAGFAQRERLCAYYALADALVFPTHSDPWGLVVNEGMACGLPVIATTAAGCSEDLVQDGYNGFSFTPGNVDELARAMEIIAGSEDLRGEMGRRSQGIIEAHSPAKCAKGIARAAAAVGEDRG